MTFFVSSLNHDLMRISYMDENGERTYIVIQNKKGIVEHDTGNGPKITDLQTEYDLPHTNIFEWRENIVPMARPDHKEPIPGEPDA